MAGVGSKPGERRGGRQKGTPNKATAEIKELASAYTVESLAMLVKVMRGRAKPEQGMAADKILDRAHGKPKQSQENTLNLNQSIIEMIERIAAERRS